MLRLLVVAVEVIVMLPPLLSAVVPFFQTKLNGPVPEAVVLKLAVAPGLTVWFVSAVVVGAITVTVFMHVLLIDVVVSVSVKVNVKEPGLVAVTLTDCPVVEPV